MVTNAESRWSFQYDDLGQVVSGRKYWLSDGAPVAGQQFEYGYDDIGNRQFAGGGGDEWGQNIAYQTYTANSLNQYTQREVPSSLQVLGTAASNSLVTVNNQPTARQGSYYRAEIGVDNIASSVYQGLTNIAVLNQGTNPDIVTNITGNIFVPQTPEVFHYDADGNLTNDGRWAYIWDAENRLVNMTAHATVPTSARLKLDFTYDPRSRRTSKKVFVWNGSSYTAQSTNKFVYDGWNLLAEFNPGNALIRNYVWGADLSGDMEGAGGVGGLLVMNIQAGGIQFVAYDGNGNVSGLVSASTGTQTAAYEYSPFGEVLRKEGASANLNPILFSTKYEDFENQLVYYALRYYSPALGGWICRDSLKEAAGLNLYGFLRNSPTGTVDVNGQIPLDLLFDLGVLIYDISTGAGAATLTADTAALIIPYVPAVGPIQRAGRKAVRLINGTPEEVLLVEKASLSSVKSVDKPNPFGNSRTPSLKLELQYSGQLTPHAPYPKHFEFVGYSHEKALAASVKRRDGYWKAGFNDNKVKALIDEALSAYLRDYPKPSFKTLDTYVHDFLKNPPVGKNMATVGLTELGTVGYYKGECVSKIKLHVDRNGNVHAFPYAYER